MLVIVDYGVGNVKSIKNMLLKIGCTSVEITSDIDKIQQAEKLILPGVGAFDTGMKNLHERNLVPVLNDLVLEKKVPVLGICLGLQLMTKTSEEGQEPGLGWFDRKTVKFQLEDSTLKVPHMGWSDVEFKTDGYLSNGLVEPRYYFVHSYHVDGESDVDNLVVANYGYEFVAGLQRDNITGVQFHPEKSHKFGIQLLKNFVEQS